MNTASQERAAAQDWREEVEAWLLNWFVGRGKARALPLKHLLETDYFEAGWLTSMEVVEFVTEIEQQFDMQFTDEDLQDSRFVTVGGVAELIMHRSADDSKSS